MTTRQKWLDYDPILESLKKKCSTPVSTRQVVNGYEIRRKMGAGTFGEVFHATKLGMQFALKRMNFNIPENNDQPYKVGLPRDQLTEAVQLTCLKHPNIVSCLDTFFHTENNGQLFLYLVMPLADVSLGKWIRRLWNTIRRDDMTDALLKKFRRFSYHVVSAVAHLERNRISHNDIKPDNFLLFGDEVRLADFGSSTLPNASSKNTCGTRIYEAPEIRLRHPSLSVLTAGDIWSVGILMLELFFGINALDIRHFHSSEEEDDEDEEEEEDDTTFTEETKAEGQPRKRMKFVWHTKYNGIRDMILRRRKHWRFLKIYGGDFEPLIDLITRCLQDDPKSRILPQAALLHPFLIAESILQSSTPIPQPLNFKFCAPNVTAKGAQLLQLEILWRLQPCVTLDPALETAALFIAHKLLRRMRKIKSLCRSSASSGPRVSPQELANAEILICELLRFNFFGEAPEFVRPVTTTTTICSS